MIQAHNKDDCVTVQEIHTPDITFVKYKRDIRCVSFLQYAFVLTNCRRLVRRSINLNLAFSYHNGMLLENIEFKVMSVLCMCLDIDTMN